MSLFPAISQKTRKTLFASSAILLVGWALSTQISQRSIAAVDVLPASAVESTLRDGNYSATAPPAAPPVARDPFATPPTATPAPAETAAPAAAAQNTAPRAPGAAGYVPNLGGGEAGAPTSAPLVVTVRGVIDDTGGGAYAIVEIAGATRFVRVGDRIGDRIAKRVDLGGITFDDGTSIGLAAGK